MKSLVESCIANYEAAEAEDDKLVLGSAFDRLDDVELDQECWEILSGFCERKGLYARQEMYAVRHLESSCCNSIYPYVTLASLHIRSLRFADARIVMSAARLKFPDDVRFRWQVVMTLFGSKDFGACLDVIRIGLNEAPNDFALRAMECRALWHLAEKKEAIHRLQRLWGILGTKAGNWTWFAAIAFEFKQASLARKAAKRLLDLVTRGESHINSSVIYLLSQCGFGDRCAELIRSAQPENYDDLTELQYLFDSAFQYGAYETAERFGRAIMALRPNSHTRITLDMIPTKMAISDRLLGKRVFRE